MTEPLGFTVHLQQPYAQALESVTAALKTEGFGVLTRIDVQATMKEKLNAAFRPYAILGACNPPLAYAALTAQAEVGLLLPCNVTVEADESGSGSVVRIANPRVMFQAGFTDNAALAEVAETAHEKLARVANALQNA